MDFGNGDDRGRQIMAGFLGGAMPGQGLPKPAPGTHWALGGGEPLLLRDEMDAMTAAQGGRQGQFGGMFQNGMQPGMFGGPMPSWGDQSGGHVVDMLGQRAAAASDGILFEPHHGHRGLVSPVEFRDALIARGFSPAAAAGFTGNAMHESAGGWKGVYLDPATDAGYKNWGTGDAAVGALQWEGPRKHGFMPTLDDTVNHIYDEVAAGKQGLTLNQINGAKSAADAASMINRLYERPKNPWASMAERQKFAQHVFGLPSGGADRRSMMADKLLGGM